MFHPLASPGRQASALPPEPSPTTAAPATSSTGRPREAEVLKAAAEALTETVAELGGIDAAAAIAGLSGDTLSRWIQGGNRDWRIDAVAAIGSAAVRHTGRFALVDRWSDLLTRSLSDPVPWRMTSNPADALPALIIEVQWLAVVVDRRHISREQARQLVGELPELRRHLDRIERRVQALLGAG